MITKIRVPARWTHFYGNGDTENHKNVAEFQLGLGPCGRVVACLDFADADNFFAIKQIHVDGSFKTFYYRHTDLIGRIEIEES